MNSTEYTVKSISESKGTNKEKLLEMTREYKDNVKAQTVKAVEEILENISIYGYLQFSIDDELIHQVVPEVADAIAPLLKNYKSEIIKLLYNNTVIVDKHEFQALKSMKEKLDMYESMMPKAKAKSI